MKRPALPASDEIKEMIEKEELNSKEIKVERDYKENKEKEEAGTVKLKIKPARVT